MLRLLLIDLGLLGDRIVPLRLRVRAGGGYMLAIGHVVVEDQAVSEVGVLDRSAGLHGQVGG
jgi:hypothetical protein